MMNLKDRADAIYEGIVNGLTNHESFNQEKIKLLKYIKDINFFNIIDDKPINYLKLLDNVKLITSQYTRDFNNSPLEQIRIIKNNFLTKKKDNAYDTKEVMKEFNGYFKNFFDEQLLDEILKKEGEDGLPYGIGEKISDKTINQMSNYSIINLEGINGFEKEFKKYLKDLKKDYTTKHTLLQQEFDKLTREGKITEEIKILNNNERQRINDLIQHIDVILEKINNDETVDRYDIIDIEESFMKNLINKLVPIINSKEEECLGLLNKNTELITEKAIETFETSATKKDELGRIGQRKTPADPKYLIAKFQAYSSGLFIKGKELCKGFSKRDKKTINTFAELDGISSEWVTVDGSKNYIDKHHKPSLYALSTNFLLTIPDYFNILEEEPVSIEKENTPSPKRTARIIEDAFKPFLKEIISMKKEGAAAFLHESKNAYSLISSVDMEGFSKSFNESWVRLRDSITRIETKEGFKWDLNNIKNKYKTLFKKIISMRGFKIDDNFSNIKLPGIKISINEDEVSLKDFEAKNDELARIKSFFENKKGGVIDEDLITELVDTLEVNKYKAINQELLDQLDGYLDRVQLLYGVPKDYRYLFLERELENGCLTELNDFTAIKLYESTNIKFDNKKKEALERNKDIIQQIDKNDYGKMLERINILDTTLNKKILEGMSLKVSVKEEERAVRIRELFKDLLINNTKQEFIRKKLVNKARLNAYLKIMPGSLNDGVVELIKNKFGSEADEVINKIGNNSEKIFGPALEMKLTSEFQDQSKKEIVKYLCGIEDKFELVTMDVIEQLNQKFNGKSSEKVLNYLRFNHTFLNKETNNSIEKTFENKIESITQGKKFQEYYEKIMTIIIGTEGKKFEDGLLWKAEADKFEKPEDNEGAITKNWNRQRKKWEELSKEGFAEVFLTDKYFIEAVKDVGWDETFKELREYLSSKFETYSIKKFEDELDFNRLINESLKDYFTKNIKKLESNKVRWFTNDKTFNFKNANDLCISLRNAIFSEKGGNSQLTSLIRQYKLSFTSINNELLGVQGNKEKILEFNEELFDYALKKLVSVYNDSDESINEQIIKYGLGIIHKDEKEQIPTIKLISNDELKKLKNNRYVIESIINEAFETGVTQNEEFKRVLIKMYKQYGMDPALSDFDKNELINMFLPSPKTIAVIEGVNDNTSQENLRERIRELSKGFWKINLNESCSGTTYAKLMKGVEYVFGLARKKVEEETYKLINNLESKDQIAVQASSIIKLLEKRCKQDLLLSKVADKQDFKNHMKEVVEEAINERAKLLVDLESLDDHLKRSSKKFIQKKMLNKILGLKEEDYIDDHDFCNQQRIDYSRFQNLKKNTMNCFNNLLNPFQNTNEIIKELSSYFNNLGQSFIKKRLVEAIKNKINNLIKNKNQVQSSTITELIPNYKQLEKEINNLVSYKTSIVEFKEAEIAKEETSTKIRKEFQNLGYRITTFIKQSRKINTLLKDSLDKETIDNILEEKDKVTSKVRKEAELKRLNDKELRFLIEHGTKLFSSNELFEKELTIKRDDFKKITNNESINEYEASIKIRKSDFDFIRKKIKTDYKEYLLAEGLSVSELLSNSGFEIVEKDDEFIIKTSTNQSGLTELVIKPLENKGTVYYSDDELSVTLKKKISYEDVEVNELIDNLEKTFYLKENLCWTSKETPDKIKKRISKIKDYIKNQEKEFFKEDLEALLRDSANDFNKVIKKKVIKSLYKEWGLYQRNWWPFSTKKVRTINKKGKTTVPNKWGLKKLLLQKLNQDNLKDLLESTGKKVSKKVLIELENKIPSIESYIENLGAINQSSSEEYQDADELINDLGESLENAVNPSSGYVNDYLKQLREQSSVKGSLNELSSRLRANIEEKIKKEAAGMLKLFKTPFSVITNFESLEQGGSEVIKAPNFLRDIISDKYRAGIENMYSRTGDVNSIIMSQFGKQYEQWYNILKTLKNDSVLTNNQLKRLMEFVNDYSESILNLSNLIDKYVGKERNPSKKLKQTSNNLHQLIEKLLSQEETSKKAIKLINDRIKDIDPSNINQIRNKIKNQVSEINPDQSDTIRNINGDIHILNQRVNDLVVKKSKLKKAPSPPSPQHLKKPKPSINFDKLYDRINQSGLRFKPSIEAINEEIKWLTKNYTKEELEKAIKIPLKNNPLRTIIIKELLRQSPQLLTAQQTPR